MRSLLPLSLLLGMMASLALLATGCDKKEPFFRRNFESDPLKALPSGANSFLQLNVRQALNQSLTRELVDQYLVNNEQDVFEFQKIKNRFGIDPMQEVSRIHLAFYDSGDPDLENRAWAMLITGHFTEDSVNAAIVSNSLAVSDQQYSSLSYKKVEMRGKIFYYMIVSPREIVFTSHNPLLRRIIEIYTGGTDFIETDPALSPLLKNVSEETMFWAVGEFVDWQREMALEQLVQRNEDVQLYPLEEAQAGILQVNVEEDLALELTLIMDAAGAAQRLTEGLSARRQGLIQAMDLIDQWEGVGQLQTLRRFLNIIQLGNEAERFQLQLTMPTDEFKQTLDMIKAIFAQLSP